MEPREVTGHSRQLHDGSLWHRKRTRTALLMEKVDILIIGSGEAGKYLAGTILGGGYVGLEMAQAMRGGALGGSRRGFRNPRAAQARRGTIGQPGVGDGGGPGGVRDIEATDILVAAGRIPNTRSVGLDQAGVDLDARGYIAVDDQLQTSAKNIWALGDCAGSPQFTHAAFDDFRVVRDNLNGGNRTTPGIGSSRSE